MIIKHNITINKDIIEALYSSLALSFGLTGNSFCLYNAGLDLYQNIILNDLEKKYITA